MFELTAVLPDIVVESLLPAAPRLVLGDVAAPDDGLELTSPEPGRRPFVWVTGSERGPVRGVWLVFRTEDLSRPPVPLGHLDCPSGRLVAGDPEAVAAWGCEVAPELGLPAQARAYDYRRRLRGLVVVACVRPGRHPVYAIRGDDGYDAVMVDVSPAGIRTGGVEAAEPFLLAS